ncbi:YdeI/OmpD-associated family protein [Gorillibacterium sp. sgz5001074]|uniref:YdeI/OmpD-associated family protein n=1 Tax=Gorillibacterium sp. sgz5001074 TaxID=3446695 RepID=UPI003F66CDF1
MNFRSTVELSKKSATGIPIPEEIVTALGAGKKPPVQVTLGDYTYRTTVGSMDGRFMLPLSAEHRTGAGLSAGDEVEVTLALDTEPREVVVPEDFAAALDADAEARRLFDKLSYSHKRQHLLAIEVAKTAETRQRRIGKALEIIKGNVK